MTPATASVGLPDGTEAGAKELGLSGAVDQGQFERLLNGELPNGVVLKRGQQGKHQPGWDLTFSAPKSVSLLALVAGDSRVVEAHNLAVSEALHYLEATTAQARIKQEGKSAIETTANWIIARFTHDTSRELDPQLHTHAVVINATRRADGEWRALSSKEMFRAKMVGGAIYRAELARALQRLGYEVEVTHQDGRFEVKGFSKEQLASLLATARGDRSRAQGPGRIRSQGERHACAGDPRPKRADRPHGALRGLEGPRQGQGIDFDGLAAKKTAPREPHSAKPAKEAVAWAIAHLTERESVIGHKDIVRHALEYGTGRVTLSEVAAGIQEAKQNRTLLPVKDSRYTTTKAVVAERETIAAMRRGQGRARPIASIEAAQAAAREHGLATDQAQAATFILTTKDRVVGVQGYAGTGKTHMLRAVREVAERAGFTVRGFAPSATAARVLQTGRGDPLGYPIQAPHRHREGEQTVAIGKRTLGGRRVIHDEHRAGEGARKRGRSPEGSPRVDRRSAAVACHRGWKTVRHAPGAGDAVHGDAPGQAPNRPHSSGCRHGQYRAPRSGCTQEALGPYLRDF